MYVHTFIYVYIYILSHLFTYLLYIYIHVHVRREGVPIQMKLPNSNHKLKPPPATRAFLALPGLWILDLYPAPLEDEAVASTSEGMSIWLFLEIGVHFLGVLILQALLVTYFWVQAEIASYSRHLCQDLLQVGWCFSFADKVVDSDSEIRLTNSNLRLQLRSSLFYNHQGIKASIFHKEQVRKPKTNQSSSSRFQRESL